MAFMVVGLHASFLGDFTPLGEYLTVNGIFRIAVPVFLIISGYYFYFVLSKNNQVNWLKRVSVLYTFWMVFYSYFWFTIPDFSFIGIARFIKDIVIGYHHLWYISGMFGAAIILILFRKLPSFFLSISIIFTFIVGVLIQYMGNYHFFGGVIDKLFNLHWFHRNMLLFSYPFFSIGYLINKHSLHKKVTFKLAGILSALGIFALLGESYINYNQLGRDGGFDNFLSLILVCPFVFMLFIKSNISSNSKNIALYSSAIYFIHPILLSVFRKFFELQQTYLTIVVIVASALISYFIIKINMKLKFIL
jgi:hypothetical protein